MVLCEPAADGDSRQVLIHFAPAARSSCAHERGESLVVSLQHLLRNGISKTFCRVHVVATEVVGEIEDEYDKGIKLWRKISANEYLINPKIEIESINDDLGLALPDGDYETLSGFLLMKAGAIPNIGEVIKYRDLEFKVQKATSRSIEEVKLVIKK